MKYHLGRKIGDSDTTYVVPPSSRDHLVRHLGNENPAKGEADVRKEKEKSECS
jgi:hypothetical protein